MMQKIAIACLAGTISLAGCATVPSAVDTVQILAKANLADAGGKSVGVATIEQTGMQATLRVSASAQTPGSHGIHLHMTGKCEAPAFTTAGGHLNPMSHQHGTLNPSGPHLGDLPNLDIGADGTGSLNVPMNTSIADLRAALFDADGSALVLHAGPDDYKTDPSGNSGGRLACGILRPAG